MRIAALITVLSLALVTCKNIDNADPSPRTSFVKFFEQEYSTTAASLEVIPEGYVILGNAQVSDTDDQGNEVSFSQTVVIQTDKNGNRVGEPFETTGGTGNSIKALITNGTVSGYVIVGDSIYLDPLAEQAANVTVSSLRVLFLDANLKSVGKFILTDTSPIAPNKVREDFSGVSVEITSDGRVIILGTLKKGVVNQQSAPAEPFILALKKNFTLDWTRSYDLLGRTSQNSKSLHYANGKIIWASAIAQVQGAFTSSWVSIPVVDENSIFPNYSVIGQNSDQLFIPKDIQTAYSPGLGFGVVGTYSLETDGAKGNMFFLRVDATGSIIPGSDRYFDAITLAVTDRTQSSIIDEGEAITSTRDDGFVIAGTTTTNPEKGNGGKDIFLVKVNSFGDLVWIKTIGGAGDEVPSAICETAEGDIVICGTNTLGDYASVFLMKTDKNGELKN